MVNIFARCYMNLLRKKLDIRGQQAIGMSFGMIFAIFLIVIFVAIAFIAIKHFLSIGKVATVGMFYDDLQDAVDDAWNGQSSSSEFSIKLPSEIKQVCFANLSAPITNGLAYEEIEIYELQDANTFLVPPGEVREIAPWKLTKHLDIASMTEEKNPYCVDATEKIIIKKGFYDKFVSIV